MKLRSWVSLATLLAATSSLAQSAAELRVYAAGSLRAALTEVARAHERESAVAVVLTFGPSGLLKDRIAGGEPAQVFASANLNHPQDLLAAGRAVAVRPFARNALCVLASSSFTLAGKPLASRLLDADVRVATSTPRADPAGDYAFAMFERIEATGAGAAGSAKALQAKALQLTGGPSSPQPQPGRSLYAQLVDEGRADAFVTYCTNAVEARREKPTLQVLAVPAAINVSAVYGVALISPSGEHARAFVDHLLGEAGQRILASHGFSAP